MVDPDEHLTHHENDDEFPNGMPQFTGQSVPDAEASAQVHHSSLAGEIAGEAAGHTAGCLLEGCAQGCGNCSCSAVVFIALLASAGSALAAMMWK